MKSLFGYAKTTKALSKSGGFCIYDDKFLQKSTDEFGNILLPINEFEPLKSTLEIPSPGFPKDHILVKKARNLISEYDFFFKNMPPSVWISGTNGKTTTTSITGFLLAQNNAEVGGNIGTPLAELKNSSLWILETSSFTLHYTKFAYPKVYILLPIKNDHISWHGSFIEYEKAKLKPLLMMEKNSVVIIPKIYENIPTNAYKITYKNEQDLTNFLNINLDEILLKPPFLLDALLALCVSKVLFDKVDINLLNTYKIEPHKLEPIQDKKERIWINDTKATNIDACVEALKRYKNEQILLILGGDDKGVDMRVLFDEMMGLNLQISLFIIGKNTQILYNLAKEFQIEAKKCNTLETAVLDIDKIHTKNKIALLSPACASLDQFSSYAQRGDDFKAFVASL